MSVRKLPSSTPASPFLLAPLKEDRGRRTGVKELPLVLQSPGAHTRKTSKGGRGRSPKSPFGDLDDVLKRLSKKQELKKSKSPKKPSKIRFSPTPKQLSPCSSPKHRKSPSPKSSSPASPRSSLLPLRLPMQLDELGVIKSPKMYSNQIFRDVFDPSGCHDKELYASYDDPSLEMYVESQGKHGICVVVPSTLPSKPSYTGSISKQTRVSPPQSPIGPELWRKLGHVQDNRGSSESETACEECKDSRKPH